MSGQGVSSSDSMRDRLREARGSHSLAPELVNLLAFFDAHRLPVETLAEHAHRVPGRLSSAGADSGAIREAIGSLLEEGILQGDDGGIWMVEELQRAVRQDLVRPQAAGYADAALRILEERDQELEDTSAERRKRWQREVALAHAPAVARRLVEVGRAPDRALVLAARAVEASGMEELEVSLEGAEEAAAIARGSARLRDPFLLAALLDQLAEIRAGLEDRDGAIAALREAVETAETVCPEDDPRRAVVLHNAGDLARRLGAAEEASRYLERCLELLGEGEGPRDALRARASLDLAEARMAAGGQDAAVDASREAVRICRRSLGPRHPETAAAWSLWGRTLRSAGRAAAAVACFRRALGVLEDTYGAEHPALGPDLGNLAETLSDLGDRERALGHHRRALHIFEEAYGQDHYLTRAARQRAAGV